MLSFKAFINLNQHFWCDVLDCGLARPSAWTREEGPAPSLRRLLRRLACKPHGRRHTPGTACTRPLPRWRPTGTAPPLRALTTGDTHTESKSTRKRSSVRLGPRGSGSQEAKGLASVPWGHTPQGVFLEVGGSPQRRGGGGRAQGDIPGTRDRLCPSYATHRLPCLSMGREGMASVQELLKIRPVRSILLRILRRRH